MPSALGNGNLVGETTTNAQGEYTLTNVPRSLTRFTAAKAPYAGMTWDEAPTNSNAYGTAVLAGVDFSATQDLQLTINFPTAPTAAWTSAASWLPAGGDRLPGATAASAHQWLVTVPDS